MFNRKSAFAAALIALGTVAAGSAHASNVQWSVAVNLPPVGTVISSAPVYVPAPVYAPAPVYVRPAPVVVYRPAPPPVVYAPAPVVYRPVPVYAPGYGVVRGGWAVPPRHHHHYGYEGWRDDRRDGDHDGRRGDRGYPEPRRYHH